LKENDYSGTEMDIYWVFGGGIQWTVFRIYQEICQKPHFLHKNRVFL